MSAVRKQPRQRKCKVCDEWYRPYSSLQSACSIKCGIKYHDIQEKRKFKRYKRDALQSLKTLSQLCSDAQKDVNRYIRIRDAGKGCISCTSPRFTDAGHRFHAGTKYRTNRIRFDHRCLNGQCEDCNRYNGGRPAEYDEGYLRRYGAHALVELHELKRQADRGELPPLIREEVGQIAAEHRRLARELMGNANKAMLA